MKEQDTKVIEAIQEMFLVEAMPAGNEISLTFFGIPDKFSLLTENDELTVFTNEWHEHFPDIAELKSFWFGMFSGTEKIVIKYRGKTPVAHQRQTFKDGKWIVVSRTGSFVSPFWRPKTYKTIEYKNCQPVK